MKKTNIFCVLKLLLVLFSVGVISALSSGCAKTETAKLDDTKYVGQFLDADINEPNLTINKNQDGTYAITISVYRLTTFDDAVGNLTKDGMEFKATDPSGAAIKGIITVDGKKATVKFTDSNWEYISNGDTFEYVRAE